ncbi:MAG: methionine biosynthesis protein MetW [Candidatus Margulisbacteria bacterium]|jgi:methionine biosynthesis protein MetW|nr:methionine biosynthesis protein MetW [Candidatus Margulisiibacteriota bacterium]
MKYKYRFDHEVISRIVEPGAKVLDLGCGTGELLFLLARRNKARVEGIELDDAAIYACVEKGLSVIHRDIDSGLAEYSDQSFDYVILNQSMQEVKRADLVIDEALRVGKKVIVGFPNFAHYLARLQIFFLGRTPVTPSLPFKWYDTPNLHFLSISDFWDYTREKRLQVLAVHYLREAGEVRVLPNLFARAALFVLTRQKTN